MTKIPHSPYALWGSPAKKRPLQGANYRVSLSSQLMKKPRVPGHLSASWEHHPSYTLLSKPVLHLPPERTFAWQSIPSVLSGGDRNRLSPFQSCSGIFCSSFSPNNSQLEVTLAFWFTACLGPSSWPTGPCSNYHWAWPCSTILGHWTLWSP